MICRDLKLTSLFVLLSLLLISSVKLATVTDRPTIFFSHASADKQTLVRLKTLFGKKVGQSIDVFLSSDGQSIPLGRNWVHKVQEALDRTSLMVIFITPGALSSGWVYFEAGYAYSKGIRVVPVGFLGIDLGQLNPPLSLLQGFNIISSDGLNNLIALSNEVFGHKHLEEFTADEFSQLISVTGASATSVFGALGDFIDEVSVDVEADELTSPFDPALEAIAKIFTAHHISHHRDPSGILGAGLRVSESSGYSQPGVSIKADPLLLQLSFPAITEVVKKIRKGGLSGSRVYFQLREGMDVVQETYKITARVHQTPIALGPEGELALDKVAFETGYFHRRNNRGNAYVCLTLPSNPLKLAKIAELFAILHQERVIFDSEQMWS